MPAAAWIDRRQPVIHRPPGCAAQPFTATAEAPPFDARGDVVHVHDLPDLFPGWRRVQRAVDAIDVRAWVPPRRAPWTPREPWASSASSQPWTRADRTGAAAAAGPGGQGRQRGQDDSGQGRGASRGGRGYRHALAVSDQRHGDRAVPGDLWWRRSAAGGQAAVAVPAC